MCEREREIICFKNVQGEPNKFNDEKEKKRKIQMKDNYIFKRACTPSLLGNLEMNKKYGFWYY